MRRVVLLVGVVLASFTVPRIVAAVGSDSSGTHSYTSACEGGLPRFTNTSDPASTGNGVIEFRAAGVTLTLDPGASGVLDPGPDVVVLGRCGRAATHSRAKATTVLVLAMST